MLLFLLLNSIDTKKFLGYSSHTFCLFLVHFEEISIIKLRDSPKNILSGYSFRCAFISPQNHFTPYHFTPYHFTPHSFHPTFISLHIHFTPHSFHPTFISPHFHFTPYCNYTKASHVDQQLNFDAYCF